MIGKGCSNTNGKARRPALLLLLFLAALLLQAPCSGQSLTLNVYLDSSGKALITGYAERISGLDFLNGSQFRLENDSHQLYALTASLTTKESDLWKLRFDAAGAYDDYRVTFFLPNQTSLVQINISQGLGYLLSASNESLVADVQGWEVSDPRIFIQYRQPLASNGNSQMPAPPAYPGDGATLIVLIVAAALVVIGFGFAVLLQRKKRGLQEEGPEAAVETPQDAEREKKAAFARMEEEAGAEIEDSQSHVTGIRDPSLAQASSIQDGSAPADPSLEEGALIAIEPEAYDPSSLTPAQPSDWSESSTSEKDTAHPDAPLSQESLRDDHTAEEFSSQEGSEDNPSKREILISSEMEAVMQTLTARERSVMSTLISHGGRMTQAEIRYETGTPKSSLTGILISLERRKLVIKKEWGRTNIIELSEWFLSKKEPS